MSSWLNPGNYTTGLLGTSQAPTDPIPGKEYLVLLHKYLTSNLPRLSPSSQPSTSILSQSYTLLTLGLDPSSQPLHRNLKVPLTLGFGNPAPVPKGPIKPLTLRLPPDRLLYLLLRWQALPQNLAHVGRTDVAIEEGVPFTSRGTTERVTKGKDDGDVQSVRSWVGSMRSVSVGSMIPGGGRGGWWSKEEPNEDQILLALYSMFNVLPALLIHPPFISDRPIAELVDAGGYTQFGGVDVRVPLDVLRNLSVLELEGYDPRALLIPPNPNLRSLTVRDVQDGDDWIEELLLVPSSSSSSPASSSSPTEPKSSSPRTNSVETAEISSQLRFPHLRHLSLPSTSLLSLLSLPLTSLTSLDLSHNLLNAIPSSLSLLPSLLSLNLSYNLITSTRNAPSALVGPVKTLNISHNRLDCLVGLDRVGTLQRVDIRFNELVEVGEVGRLAILPKIKEVWTIGNPFNTPEEGVVVGDWRVELGVKFGEENKEVIVDDSPFTFLEKRNIENKLIASGKYRKNGGGHSKASTVAVGSAGSVRLSKPHSTSTPISRIPTPLITTQSMAGPSKPPISPTPSTATNAGIGKKRRPRRLINLDDGLEDGNEVKGGSMRLPPKTILHEEGENHADGHDDKKESNGGVTVLKKGRRERVSASMFEP